MVHTVMKNMEISEEKNPKPFHINNFFQKLSFVSFVVFIGYTFELFFQSQVTGEVEVMKFHWSKYYYGCTVFYSMCTRSVLTRESTE